MTSLAQEFGFTADHAAAIADKGFDLLESGDLEAASAVFDGLVAINPNDASMHAALGATRQRQGRLDEAEAEYSVAIGLNSAAMLARVNRGELRLNRGDPSGMDDLEVAANAQSELKAKAQRLITSFKR